MTHRSRSPRAAAPIAPPAAALLAVTLALFLTAAPCRAGITVTSSLVDEHQGSPGETYTASIRLHNSGPSPARARIYQADYSFQSDGSNDYGPPGSSPRSNAGWIALPASEVTVPAGGSMGYSMTIRIPSAPGLLGSYWSLVMVEPVPDKGGGPIDASKEGLKVTMLTRYGIQIVTDVAGAAAGNLEFFDPVLKREADGARFTVDLRNTGERWMKPQVWLRLFDASGAEKGRFESTRMRIYPGSSARFAMDLPALEQGVFPALVVADAGGADLFGLNLQLRLE